MSLKYEPSSEPQSIKYWVADEVKDYILANNLYDPPTAKLAHENGHPPAGNGGECEDRVLDGAASGDPPQAKLDPPNGNGHPPAESGV